MIGQQLSQKIVRPILKGENVVYRLSLLLGKVEEKLAGGAASRLVRNSNGVTAVEYGLIAALIAVAAVVVMGTTGTDLSSVFNTVANNL